MRFRYSSRKIAKLFANSGDPDQMQHCAASDLGLHCLLITPDYNGLNQKLLHVYLSYFTIIADFASIL